MSKKERKKSHPTMGAWIEIIHIYTSLYPCIVAPHDGCVDWNSLECKLCSITICRTPRWVRGLKLVLIISYNARLMSHPTMGAWIEIKMRVQVQLHKIVAPHDGCVDWNAINIWKKSKELKCRTPRWVRGLKYNRQGREYEAYLKVAPHDGCVDWNNTAGGTLA